MTGVLLERHIPKFSVREGVSYQVELSTGHTVDFLLRKDNGGLIVIECHPFRLRQRLSRKEYKDWRRAMRSFDAEDRERVVDITQHSLVHDYYRDRLEHIRTDPNLRTAKLLIVSSIEDLYRHVLPEFVPKSSIAQNEREFSTSASKLKRHIKKTATVAPPRVESDLSFHRNRKLRERRQYD